MDVQNNTTPAEEVKSSKLYYSISEVAARFDVNTSLIRYWEAEFDFINPQKNNKGNRLFTQQDIDLFGLIYHYVKERGMTLDGARRKIKENREDAENTYQIVQSLKKVRNTLLSLKNNMDDLS
ncbi:MAG: MerR family transcriptional regulator [Bacteroidales bacterium]|jgi:DNA-binding transcriptional MerR regulator|nr:MerR family transcriptional regulator [Bacteroidales bacterium]